MKNHHKKRLTRAQKIEASRKGVQLNQGEKVVKINGEVFRPAKVIPGSEHPDGPRPGTYLGSRRIV